MNAILEAEARRDLIINNVCVPCAADKRGKRCDCCMDHFALIAIENEINEAADAEAERRA